MLRLLLFFVFSLLGVHAFAQNSIGIPQKALVELFTSQGCSSCPPAQKKLDAFIQDSTYGENSFVLLSFHVDYWDNTSWKDSFAKPAFTARQGNYRQLFKEDGLYTPQLVVNGIRGFSGNNDSRLRREIKPWLTKDSGNVNLRITSLSQDSLRWIFTYELDSFLTNRVVCVALVSTSDTVEVLGGENAGTRLISSNTVRNFIQIPLRKDGAKAFINQPANLPREALRLVYWVQDTERGVISDVILVDLAHRAIPQGNK